MQKTRFYIAARLKRVGEAKGLRVRLEDRGYQVTSSWLDRGYQPEETGFASVVLAREAADTGLQEVRDCNALILLSEKHSSARTVGGGGRHVEVGYALALSKTIAIIGERENVFHFVSGVLCFANADELLKWAMSL